MNFVTKNHQWATGTTPMPPRAASTTELATGTPAAPSRMPTLWLVAADEHEDTAALAEGLREQGDDVSRVAPTSDCRHREERQPHLLLFRLTRPDSLGEAKGTGAFAAGASGVPAVVHIVDQAEEEDRITALDSGVDDVVVLPVSTRELAARVRAIIRRSHSAPRRLLLTYKDIVLDPVAGEATRNGRHRSLTRKEFRLLQVLMEHLGRPVSRQRLVEKVWGPGHHLEMRTVDAHIHRLRAAMGDDRAEVIRTVRHAGYVMGDQAQPGAS